MDRNEREKLEHSCAVCREAGIEGDQLLLVRLDCVEEYLRLEKLARDIYEIVDKLDQMKKTLDMEVNGVFKADTGETEGCNGSD